MRPRFSTTCCRFPITNATVDRVSDHIDEVQEAFGRPILLENPSTYVAFRESTMSESYFIRELARRTGCGLLLDVNNVFVSAANHHFSALDYLPEFPLERVGEIHLAGHAGQSDDEGELLLIDSHDGPVADAVWKLFELVVDRRGPVPTLVEWDSNIPEWMASSKGRSGGGAKDSRCPRDRPPDGKSPMGVAERSEYGRGRGERA